MHVLTVGNGVLGNRGFVELGSPVYFCSDDCVGEYFGSGLDVEKRVP